MTENINEKQIISRIEQTTTSNLSFYKTEHDFENYAEFTTVEEFTIYCQWAKENGNKLYILGNGSNTLFIKKNIKTLILKNKLEPSINLVTKDNVEISSSTLIIDVLKFCYKNSFDSFYYLASVPATIGGALAMNAGRGWKYKSTIYDFVESVTFFDFNSHSIQTLSKEHLIKGYRSTIFTGLTSFLIIKAVFNFNKITLKNNPIKERIQWSKKNQDNSSANCGSVFKKYQPFILKIVKGLEIHNSSFSRKVDNWLLNRSKNSWGIVFLINLVKVFHLIIGKKAVLEVIEVD